MNASEAKSIMFNVKHSKNYMLSDPDLGYLELTSKEWLECT